MVSRRLVLNFDLVGKQGKYKDWQIPSKYLQIVRTGKGLTTIFSLLHNIWEMRLPNFPKTTQHETCDTKKLYLQKASWSFFRIMFLAASGFYEVFPNNCFDIVYVVYGKLAMGGIWVVCGWNPVFWGNLHNAGALAQCGKGKRGLSVELKFCQCIIVHITTQIFYGVQCINFLACIFGPILYSYFKEFRTQYVCISYHL